MAAAETAIGTRTAKPAAPPLRFRRDLEGLRGVAVVLVILFHAGVDPLAGGYVGVDVFFVLSGFLISALLVREVRSGGRVGFREFYARRFRRLLPALLVVVFASLGLAVLFASPQDVQDWARTALSVPTFTANLLFARRSSSYLGGDLDGELFLNMWSLAVEEQFYLVWPALLLVAYRARRGRTSGFVAVIGAVVVLSAGAGVVLTQAKSTSAFFGPVSRFWEFGVGALIALIPIARAPKRLLGSILSLAGLGLVVASAVVLDGNTRYPGTAVIGPVAGTALVLWGGVDPDRRVNPFLEVRPVRWLGTRSYSWYLWHWPLLVLFDLVRPGFGPVSGLLVCAAALGLADLTYRWVEDPVRHAPTLVRDARLTVRLGLVAIAGSLVLLGALIGISSVRATQGGSKAAGAAADDIHEAFENKCVARFLDPEPLPVERCSYGDLDADRTLVIFGDSHAAHWVPALDVIGREHEMRVVLLAKSSCPSADVPTRLRVDGQPYEACDEFRRSAHDVIDRLDPDHVVLSNASSYLEGEVSPSAWEAGTSRTLERVSAPGRRVTLLHDVPAAPFSVPTCLGRQSALIVLDRSDCTFPRSTPALAQAQAAEERAAAAAGVDAVETAPEVCAQPRCAPVKDGTVIYFDTSHLTGDLAIELAPWLAEQLQVEA